MEPTTRRGITTRPPGLQPRGSSLARVTSQIQAKGVRAQQQICNVESRTQDDMSDMTAIYDQLIDDAPEIRMTGMFLYLLSPEDLLKHCSAVEVGYKQFGVIGGGGEINMNDARMGAIGSEVCGTCKSRLPTCQGHMGNIPLYVGTPATDDLSDDAMVIDYSVYNPLFIRDVAMLSRMVCIACSQIIFNPTDLLRVAHEMPVDMRGSIRVVFDKIASRQNACMHCKAVQPDYSVVPKANMIYYHMPGDVTPEGDKIQYAFLPRKAYRALMAIDNSNEMRVVLGFTASEKLRDRSSPLGMIIRYLPVLPRYMRQPFKSENGAYKEHPLVSKYIAVARAMQDIRRILTDLMQRKVPEEKKKGTKPKKKEKIKEDKRAEAPPNTWIYQVVPEAQANGYLLLLANHYATIRTAIIDIYTNINKKIPSQARATFMGTLGGGKKNFMRKSAYNKRVEQSARFVISPGPGRASDPNAGLRFGEYGIPRMVKSQLPVKVKADVHNIDDLRRLLTAKSVTKVTRGNTNFVFWEGLVYTKPRANFRIEIGDYVYRHCQDGDIIILGRNPTIHRYSLSAFTVKLTDTLTGLLKLSNVGSKNADFDGDEMNAFIVDSAEAIREARELMHVQNCLISGASNAPVEGPVIDAVTGSYLMSLPNKYITLREFIYLAQQVSVAIERPIDIYSLLDRSLKYNRAYLSPRIGGRERVTDILKGAGLNYQSPSFSIQGDVVTLADEIEYRDWRGFIDMLSGADVLRDFETFIPSGYSFYSDYFRLEAGKLKQILAAPPNEILRALHWLADLEVAPISALRTTLRNFETPSIVIEEGEVFMTESVNYLDLQRVLDRDPQAQVVTIAGDVIPLLDFIREHNERVSASPEVTEYTERARKADLAATVLEQLETYIPTRTAYSMVYPADFAYEMGGNVITEGILRTGPLKKSDIGAAAESIEYYIIQQYGPGVTIDYMDAVEAITSAYLDAHGLTISVESCLYGDERVKQIKDEALRDLEQEIRQIAPPTNESERIRYEKTMTSKLAIMPQIARKIIEILPPDHPLRAIVESGAKGKADVIAQIGSILGQQYIRGKRFQPMMTGNTRCSTRYVPNTHDIKSRGFCRSSLMDGPDPEDYQKHSAASRPTILDTAVNTSTIGSRYRSITRAVTDIRNQVDGTVRDVNNNVIQFAYGNDNFNPARLIRLKAGGRQILSFVNIVQEALNISGIGTNRFRVTPPAFNLTNISHIIGYPELITNYFGDVTLQGVAEHLVRKGIVLTPEQLDSLHALNDGVSLQVIQERVLDLRKTSGEEIIGYKQVVQYPHLIKSGRDVIVYVDPQDIPRMVDVLRGYDYTSF